MISLVAAYIVVWVAATGYVAWLGVQQQRLASRLDDLEQARRQNGAAPRASSRAA